MVEDKAMSSMKMTVTLFLCKQHKNVKTWNSCFENNVPYYSMNATICSILHMQ